MGGARGLMRVERSQAAQMETIGRHDTDLINCGDRCDNLSLVWHKLHVLPVKL